ncbi:methionine ABC transporter permease [Rouxiella silvae]|uniref:D-methionine transport system permease protein MetI n=1 Tax=Rouxiella silvae TaxID=1646373 RepID=A0AA40X2C8_9GAMM|nr:methionine ABC transporter permease [Rouxiella silvae]KQN52173.1 methionine ABC transporter permease [Serratia sp. Leaf50]MBF6637283.1 ABC transporter permease [Rouxiella silvae]ORJ19081.1 methionine ABC transporter permease [Rouxiella silvae]
MFETAITLDQFIAAMQDTLLMVSVSLLIGSLLGVPLGILLVITRPGGLVNNRFFYTVINPIINIVRSLPFIILMISIIPFTRLVVHTTIGTAGAIVPLIIFIAPYIARLVESSLLEINPGIIEAAKSMGATPMQAIWHFLLPEALASLVLALTTATIGLIGATAMAGTVGGGGIGDLAITYGYQRFDTFATVSTAVVLIIVVQGLQSVGNVISRRLRRES